MLLLRNLPFYIVFLAIFNQFDYIQSARTTKTIVVFLEAGQPGLIDYPEDDKFYNSNVRICWIVHAPLGYGIKYKLIDSEMGFGYFGDGLDVYDGDSIDSRKIDYEINGPAGTVFFAPRNVSLVCFHSNQDGIEGMGFKLRLEAHKKKVEISENEIVDCETILRANSTLKSGIYKIYPFGRSKTGVFVFCDMNTFGGGWIVFQRRLSGVGSFEKSWRQYRLGFGDKAGDFWLGNDALSFITTAGGYPPADYTLLIAAETREGQTAYLHFDSFFVENESENFKWHFLGKPICNTTNGVERFSMIHNHRNFTTMDRDNDDTELTTPYKNFKECSAKYGNSGWWFKSCYNVNLNGIYGKEDGTGMVWWYFQTGNKHRSVLVKTKMMIRRTKMSSCPENFEFSSEKNSFSSLGTSGAEKFTLMNISLVIHLFLIANNILILII